MKKLFYVFAIVLAFSFVSCDSDDVTVIVLDDSEKSMLYNRGSDNTVDCVIGTDNNGNFS